MNEAWDRRAYRHAQYQRVMAQGRLIRQYSTRIKGAFHHQWHGPQHKCHLQSILMSNVNYITFYIGRPSCKAQRMDWQFAQTDCERLVTERCLFDNSRVLSPDVYIFHRYDIRRTGIVYKKRYIPHDNIHEIIGLSLSGGFMPCRHLRPSSGREHTIVTYSVRWW